MFHEWLAWHIWQRSLSCLLIRDPLKALRAHFLARVWWSSVFNRCRTFTSNPRGAIKYPERYPASLRGLTCRMRYLQCLWFALRRNSSTVGVSWTWLLTLQREGSVKQVERPKFSSRTGANCGECKKCIYEPGFVGREQRSEQFDGCSVW